MASGNMKDIKRRIKSVQSTMQITKAMELVASSKMRRAKERALGARPYFNALYQTITRLAGATRGSESVYTKPARGQEQPVHRHRGRPRTGRRLQRQPVQASPLPRCRASRHRSSPSAKRRRSITRAKRPVTVAADYPGIAETMRISECIPSWRTC